MKKNVIAILLAVCMLLALTACVAKAPTADTASDNTAADAAPAETPADTTENTEEPSADDGKVYTSDARLPLQGAAIAVTRHGAAGTELVAFRVSNYDGMTEPIRVETPDFSESQQSGAAEQPFANLDIEAEATGYGRIFIRNAQVFADRQTVQPLRLIPTPSLPESYTRTQIVDVTPQDL